MNLKPTIRCLTFAAQLSREDYTEAEIADIKADLEYMDYKDNPERKKYKRRAK